MLFALGFLVTFVIGETVVTTLLHEDAGRTTLTTTILYASQAARDGALRSGMEQGLAASYDRLAELLKELTAA